jgi:RNA polymerase sigma-70 factor (ECF subfamily)
MAQTLGERGELPAGEGGFHTTHWSVVLAARERDDQTVAREALARLCSTYWYPLYAFIRRQGTAPAEAEDLTQEFFFRFLQRESLKGVSPAAGKFRSFLLACLKHFLINERERAHAQRRGGGVAPLPLAGGDGETQYLLEPADNLTPEVLFERRWALAVLDQALKRLADDYARRNHAELFEALKGFLPGSQGGLDRAQVAARQGMSAGTLDVAIHRLKKRFGTMLREEVAQTVSSEAEVEEELRYLIRVLGS